MNESMKIIMGAVLGIGNIGMPHPTVDELVLAVKHPPKTANDAVCMLGGSFIESEKMLEMFVDEAESWVEVVSDYGEAKCREIWPDYWKLYDQAVAQAAEGAKA